MSQSDQPIIVGAGPVGLGAALFLARHGQATRIVEMREEPAHTSKALAVNPRTLDILEPTGVTERMLKLGSPIHGVCFHREGYSDMVLSLSGIHPRYPFMLALSQATTERLLAEALEANGGKVERGVKLVECRMQTDGVEVTLESSSGAPDVAQCPWLLAADGAHSTVRKQLGIDFPGSSFPDEWHLADVPLRTKLPSDHGHVFMMNDGSFLFLIPVIQGDQRDRTGEQVWRVISNRPEPLSMLREAEQAGEPLWTSSFHIAHRINETLTKEQVYFAGDAAHIHSPLGARGMNLGLEDAWVFAELMRANRLSEYNQLRRPVDKKVVRQVETLSRIVTANTWWYRFVRKHVFPIALKVSLLRSRMLQTVTGLDHPLPEIATST